MLKPADLHKQVKDREDLARKALEHCVPKGFTPSLGKYEAVNHGKMKETMEKAMSECPDAAATISWLLWHNVMSLHALSLLSDPNDA